MNRTSYTLAVLTLLLTGIIVAGTGCKKPVAPPPAVVERPAPAPAPPAPSPTISLSASPSTIEKGQSSTLSWSTTNSTSVTIDGGIGTVEPSGNRTVTPADSMTYTARATGPGGNATTTARVTVTAPPAPAPAPRPLTDAEFFAEKVKDIFFDYDRYDIREDARVTLLGNARALAERPHLRFTIEGHCDERGSERYNLALGDRRANAAREFITGQGVGGDRIDTISYGEERPFAQGQSEEAWSQNRRAHFVLR